MKFSIAAIVFTFFMLNAFAQRLSYEPFKDPNKRPAILRNLDVRQDSRVDSLLLNHIRQNQRKAGTEGFRVEIFFSSGSKARENAMRKKTEFLRSFPDQTAYMSFQSPNFKVRVGDCRTKSEALKLKEEIRSHYPNAFIVPDVIQFPKLYTDKKSNE
ncbi:MAG: SPOR domain-containing protein [Prolixibacteraceae bacterium]